MKSKINKILGLAVVFTMLASMVIGLTAVPAAAAVGTMDFGVVSTPSNVGNVLGAKNAAATAIGNPVASVIAASADGKTVFVWDENIDQMYKSTNSGVTFGNGVAITRATAGTAVLDMKVSPNFATDNTLVLVDVDEVWWSTNGGTSYASVAPADIVIKLEGGTITSVDVANYYANNTLNVLIGVTGGAGLISNALRFNSGDFAWTQVGNIETVGTDGAGIGIGDFPVVGVKFSPSHMSDAEILCVYNSGTSWLASRYANLEWNAITPALSLKAGEVATSADIAMASDYVGNSSAPILVGLSGGAADDLFRVTGRAAGAGTSGDLDVGGTATNTSIDRLAVGGPAASAGVLWTVTGGASAAVTRATGLVGTFTIGTGGKQPTGTVSAYPLWTGATTAIVATTGINGAVSVSADSGTTWNQTALMNIGVLVDLTLVDFTVVDANTMFVVMNNADTGAVGLAARSVFKTTDAGATYQRVLTGATLAEVIVSPAYATDSTIIVIEGTTTIRKSVNGGASFSTLFQPAAVMGALLVDANTLYTGAAAGFYKSGRFTNATGLTTAGNVFSIARNLKDTTNMTFAIGTAAATASVYETKDGGVSFTRVGSAAVAAGDNIYVAYDKDGVLFAAGDKTATGGIYKWTGTAWLTIAPVAFNGAGLAVTADGTLYATDNTASAAGAGGVWRSLNPTATNATTGASTAVFQQMNSVNFGTVFLAGYLVTDMGVVSTATDNTVYAIETTTPAATGAYGYIGRIYGIKDTFIVGPVISSPKDKTLLTTPTSATVAWTGIAGAPPATTVYALAAATDAAFTVAAPASVLAASGLSASWATGVLTAGTNYYTRVAATAPIASRNSVAVVFTTALAAVNPEPVATNPVPRNGAVEVGIDTTFTWPAVAGVTGYYFVIAQETGQTDKFAIIDYSATTPTNAFKLRENLKYDTQYWWRVQPYSATTTGAWTTFFFTTMKEPVAVEPTTPSGTVTPPVVITQVPPPEITLEIPASPVPVQVIPNYLLWAVVGVGAVLVIAVIVLIVRTRRIS